MAYGQPRIPIGARRERVTLQRAVVADDGMGGRTVTKWKTVGEPWAAVQALDERTHEDVSGQQVTAQHGYHVVLPYRSDVTPDWRVVVRGVTMQIHTVADDEGRRRRLVVQAREVQA